MKKKSVIVKPYFISSSEQVNVEWAAKFAGYLPTVAAKYGVSKALEDQVTACNNTIQVIARYEKLIGEWLGEWRVLKNALYDGASTVTAPQPFPQQPLFPVTPDPVGGYVLAPLIQAAYVVLGSPALSDSDRELLGLVKAAGRPVPVDGKQRERAEHFNYPVLKLKQVNSVVVVEIVRGSRFKGKVAVLEVDREGKGVFNRLVITSVRQYEDPVVLPIGQQQAAWAYRAIYMEGSAVASEWSPAGAVVVSYLAPVPALQQQQPATPMRALSDTLADLAATSGRQAKAEPTKSNGAVEHV